MENSSDGVASTCQPPNTATHEMFPQTETSSVKGGRKGMNEKCGDSTEHSVCLNRKIPFPKKKELSNTLCCHIKRAAFLFTHVDNICWLLITAWNFTQMERMCVCVCVCTSLCVHTLPHVYSLQKVGHL